MVMQSCNPFVWLLRKQRKVFFFLKLLIEIDFLLGQMVIDYLHFVRAKQGAEMGCLCRKFKALHMVIVFWGVLIYGDVGRNELFFF